MAAASDRCSAHPAIGPIVTRNGTPVAELRPVSPRRFVSRNVLAQAAATAPRIDAARFRADLDAIVDQGVDV